MTERCHARVDALRRLLEDPDVRPPARLVADLTRLTPPEPIRPTW
ncbi:hypothetical protein ACQEVX_35255 [Streptomyces syringium]